MRYPESRHERRVKARLEELANKMTPRLPKNLRAGRPRYGVDATPEQLSEREKILKKHGVNADERKESDRRQGDRRRMTMSQNEVDDWLKRNGISGGDRRHNDRRKGDRRRR
jgi:hypothetical protein